MICWTFSIEIASFMGLCSSHCSRTVPIFMLSSVPLDLAYFTHSISLWAKAAWVPCHFFSTINDFAFNIPWQCTFLLVENAISKAAIFWKKNSYWKMKKHCLAVKHAFPSCASSCVVVFIGLLEAVGDDGVEAQRFQQCFDSHFLLVRRLSPITMPTNCSSSLRILWLCPLNDGSGGSCFALSSSALSRSQWLKTACGSESGTEWVVWQMLGSKKLWWHWNSLRTYCFSDFPA